MKFIYIQPNSPSSPHHLNVAERKVQFFNVGYYSIEVSSVHAESESHRHYLVSADQIIKINILRYFKLIITSRTRCIIGYRKYSLNRPTIIMLSSTSSER